MRVLDCGFAGAWPERCARSCQPASVSGGRGAESGAQRDRREWRGQWILLPLRCAAALPARVCGAAERRWRVADSEPARWQRLHQPQHVSRRRLVCCPSRPSQTTSERADVTRVDYRWNRSDRVRAPLLVVRVATVCSAWWWCSAVPEPPRPRLFVALRSLLRPLSPTAVPLCPRESCAAPPKGHATQRTSAGNNRTHTHNHHHHADTNAEHGGPDRRRRAGCSLAAAAAALSTAPAAALHGRSSVRCGMRGVIVGGIRSDGADRNVSSAPQSLLPAAVAASATALCPLHGHVTEEERQAHALPDNRHRRSTHSQRQQPQAAAP